MPLGGQSLVVHAARNLLAARAAGDQHVRVLVVTAPADHVERVRASSRRLADVTSRVPWSSPAASDAGRRSVAGRRSRPLVGRRPDGADVDVVLVHDAARPLAPAVAGRARDRRGRAGHAAVVPGLPVTDTIKRVARPAARGRAACWRPSRAPSCAPSRRRRASRATCCCARTRTVAADAPRRGAGGLRRRRPGRAAGRARVGRRRRRAGRQDHHAARPRGRRRCCWRPMSDRTTSHAASLPRTGIGVDVHAYDAAPAPGRRPAPRGPGVARRAAAGRALRRRRRRARRGGRAAVRGGPGRPRVELRHVRAAVGRRRGRRAAGRGRAAGARGRASTSATSRSR